MNKLTRISATVASSVALVAGFTGVAGASSMDTTGSNSRNHVERRHSVETKVRNDNKVRVSSHNPQTAQSGSVRASDNTTLHHVNSGEAMNDSLLEGEVSVNNSNSASTSAGTGAGGNGGGQNDDAKVDTTGSNSHNSIRYIHNVDTRINNNNDISVTNYNSQRATSGSVKVDDNTTVGNVTSGNASNVSTTTFQVHVKN